MRLLEYMGKAILVGSALFYYTKATGSVPVDSTTLVYTLSEATVQGVRSPQIAKSATPLQSISHTSFNKQGITDIADALNRMSGVTLHDYGGAGGLKTVSVRGLGAQHTAVSYDGITLSDCQNGQIDLSRFTIDNIQELSLAIGDFCDLLLPARSLAAATTVNIRTIQKQTDDYKNHFTLRIKQGSFGMINPMLRYEKRFTPQWSMNAIGSFYHATNDYPFTLKNGLTSTRERRSNSRMNTWHLEWNTIYQPTSQSELTTKMYYYDNNSRLPGAVIVYNLDNKEQLRERTFFTQANYKTELDKHWTVAINGKFNWNESRYNDTDKKYPGGELHQNYLQRELYTSGVVKYAPSQEWAFSYAADYAYNEMSSNLNVDADVWRHTVWQSLNASFQSPRLTATARLLGAIYKNGSADGNRAKNVSRITPSASVSWKVLPSTPFYIRAFYKDIYRVPTFSESYYYHLGSTDLQPEQTSQIGLGATLHLSPVEWLPELTFTVDGYHNNVKDKISAIPVNLFVWQMQNIEKVGVWGMDATLNMRIRIGEKQALCVIGNYTYQKVENRKNAADPYYGFQLAYTPLHSGSASFTYENPWANVVFHFTAASERYSTNEHATGTLMKDYSDCGAAVYRTFSFGKHSLEARFDLLNIFDKQYEIIRRYPMPGRAYKVSLSFKF